MDVPIFVENELLVLVVALGFTNKGLDEVNAEEAEQVDKRGDEAKDAGEFGKGEDVERGGVTDLVTPPVEEEIGDGKEEGEENAVGEIKRERESIGGLGRGRLVINGGGGGRRRVFSVGRLGGPPADIHN